jgi:methylated-DNA-protein-cysteine methyltransferase related protein
VNGAAPDPRALRDERILAVIRSLREGEVVTYGDIAADAGFPGLSRLVGRLLATVDDDLPWWRVVNAGGRLVPGHEREQTRLLRREGTRTDGAKVTSAQFGRFAPTPAVSPARQSPARRRRASGS